MISTQTTTPFIVIWALQQKCPILCSVMLLLVGRKEMMSWEHSGKRQTELLDKTVLYDTASEAWAAFAEATDTLPPRIGRYAVREYCLRMAREAGQ